MTELTTLTIRIDAALKRRLEDHPVSLHYSVDEYAVRLINEALFINSPEFFDPDNWEAHEYRLVREGIRSGMCEPTIPLEEVEKEFRERFASNPTALPPGTSVPDTDGSSSTGSC